MTDIAVKPGEMVAWEIWQATSRLNRAIETAAASGYKVEISVFDTQTMSQRYPTPTIQASVFVEMEPTDD